MNDAYDLTIPEHCPPIVHHIAEAVVEHGVEYRPGWYFWRETWADRSGPFDSRDRAERELSRYMNECLGYSEA